MLNSNPGNKHKNELCYSFEPELDGNDVTGKLAVYAVGGIITSKAFKWVKANVQEVLVEPAELSAAVQLHLGVPKPPPGPSACPFHK